MVHSPGTQLTRYHFSMDASNSTPPHEEVTVHPEGVLEVLEAQHAEYRSSLLTLNDAFDSAMTDFRARDPVRYQPFALHLLVARALHTIEVRSLDVARWYGIKFDMLPSDVTSALAALSQWQPFRVQHVEDRVYCRRLRAP